VLLAKDENTLKLRDLQAGDVVRFDCKIVDDKENRLGIVGIEAENIFEACDLKNYKERIFKVPLFMDEDEHIFYSPLAFTKA